MTVTATLLLGSNLGERRDNIGKALTMLSEALGTEPLSATPVVETEALGFEGPDFCNCAVRYACPLGPFELLALCKDIEYRMGRRETVEYGPDGRRIYHNRIIDIDILEFGDLRINTGELVIPHPQTYSRPFVKELLNQLI